LSTRTSSVRGSWVAISRPVRAARSDRHAAGSRAQVHRARTDARARVVREAPATPAERMQAAERLSADVAGSGVPKADVVIEAIFEDLDAKRALYAAAEPRMRAGALLATNTSSLTLETLSGELRDPGQFVACISSTPCRRCRCGSGAFGAHSPGSAGRGDGLHAPPRQTAAALPQQPGFPRQPRAVPLPARGIACRGRRHFFNAIDRAAVDLACPWDLWSCPMWWSRCRAACGRNRHPRAAARISAVRSRLRSLVQAGELGRKSGQGFYRWRDGKSRASPIACRSRRI